MLRFLSTLSLRRATTDMAKRLIEFRFLSTLSLRRATILVNSFLAIFAFLSTLSLRRATARRDSRQQPAGISIHALLAESDAVTTLEGGSLRDFYPRSPCGERPGKIRILNDILNFYPRSPCGERLKERIKMKKLYFISIHALLAESDHALVRHEVLYGQFLSTLSLRRATHASM